MQLVRSVVAKVSNNLQYCRSISNRQSRGLCTSLRHNDNNSTKELRGMLCDVIFKGVGLVIVYGPYAALGGALSSVGWYAHDYATACRDREKHESELFNLKLKALKNMSKLLDLGDKHALLQVDITREQNRILSQKIVEQDEKLKELLELFKQLSKNST